MCWLLKVTDGEKLKSCVVNSVSYVLFTSPLSSLLSFLQLSSPFTLCNSSSSPETSHNPLLSQTSSPSLSPSLVLYLSLSLFLPFISPPASQSTSSSPSSLPLLIYFLTLSLLLSALHLLFSPLFLSLSPFLPFISLRPPEAYTLVALLPTTEVSEAPGTKTLSLEVSLYSVCLCALTCISCLFGRTMEWQKDRKGEKAKRSTCSGVCVRWI